MYVVSYNAARNAIQRTPMELIAYIFINFSVMSWRSVLFVRKPEYPETTTNLS
jgi:hypothetical protein